MNADTAWPSLLRTALLGVARSGLDKPAPGGPLGDALAALPSDDDAAWLLSASAIVDATLTAGRVAEPLAVDPPPSPPDEITPPLTDRQVALLRTIRDDSRLAPMTQEWFELARGRHLPPHALVECFDVARNDEAFARLLPAVVGERGRWLAAMNPRWQSLLAASAQPADGDDDWDALQQQFDEGDHEPLLDRSAAVDAQRGIDALTAAWPTLDKTRRGHLLSWLMLSLDPLPPSIEPLLELALQPRELKGTRDDAAAALSCLPSSAFAQRMIERAAAAVTITPRKALAAVQVEPPTECDKAMADDGVPKKKPKSTSLGERAFWLQQVVERVPLSHWTASSGLLPAQLIAAFAASDWKDVFLGDNATGLYAAAAIQRDAAWAEALVREAMLRDGAPLHALAPVVAVMPERDVEAIVQAMLTSGHRVSGNAVSLVLRAASRFSDSLSRAVLDAAIRELTEAIRSAGTQQAYEVRHRVMSELKSNWAMQLAPATLGDAIQRLGDIATVSASQSAGIEAFIATASLRLDLIRAFEPSNNA